MNLSTAESRVQMASSPLENSNASKCLVSARLPDGKLLNGGVRSTVGDGSAAILVDHGQRAADQIANAVGQFRIVAADQGVVAEAAVLAEDHFTQQKIAQRFESHYPMDGFGADDIAARLAHFIVLEEQPAVGENAPRDRQVRGHQEGGPEDRMEAHNFLADEVQVRRPETSCAKPGPPTALR